MFDERFQKGFQPCEKRFIGRGSFLSLSKGSEVVVRVVCPIHGINASVYELKEMGIPFPLREFEAAGIIFDTLDRERVWLEHRCDRFGGFIGRQR